MPCYKAWPTSPIVLHLHHFSNQYCHTPSTHNDHHFQAEALAQNGQRRIRKLSTTEPQLAFDPSLVHLQLAYLWMEHDRIWVLVPKVSNERVLGANHD